MLFDSRTVALACWKPTCQRGTSPRTCSLTSRKTFGCSRKTRSERYISKNMLFDADLRELANYQEKSERYISKNMLFDRAADSPFGESVSVEASS